MIPLYIPSPPINGFNIGPVRIHFYALCILTGIILAWWLSARRWRARGGRTEALETVVMWAIPLGIIGARIYHVATHIQDYFGPGRNPVTVFYIWEGGLGIMGAVALGAVGAWIGARHEKVSLATLADVMAPGIIFAQAIGRLGNYFNQELFGGPTTLPWALQIDLANRPPGYERYATFHPTFLYEMIWDIAVGFTLLWLDRRFKMGYGKLFFSYVALYCLGRLGTESLRIDPADLIFGIRNHQFITGVLLVVALIMLAWLFRYRPGREPNMVPVLAASEEVAASPVGETGRVPLDSDGTVPHTEHQDADDGGSADSGEDPPQDGGTTDQDASATGVSTPGDSDGGDPANR